MNKICLINGSPKYKDSASEKYLDIIYHELDEAYKVDEIDTFRILPSNLKTISEADILVFASPLYIDSLPSHFIKYLVELENYGISNKLIYAIFNCGYYEGIQNELGLKIIENFSIKTNSKYMGGIGIGGGPVGFHHKFYAIPIIKMVKKMGSYINTQSNFNNHYVNLLLPRWIYIGVANFRWFKKIKSLK